MSEKNHLGTIWSYLQWRGDLLLTQDGFNEVDNLLLCIISYIDFRRIDRLCSPDPADAMTIGGVCACLTEQDEQVGLSPEPYIPLMRAVAATKRFEEVKMFAFEDRRDAEKEMQFAAVSFLLPDNSVFVAYRGTDTSLVGWKEDFNMSFMSGVPAQLRATEYAVEIARRCPKRILRIGGHSKGGNLAAWAAMHLPEKLQRKRLLAAYNNDGPGFLAEVLQEEGCRQLGEKLYTFVPESSIVGILLEHGENYEVIASHNKAVMQHEPLSWAVLGKRFVRRDKYSEGSRITDDVLKEWIASTSLQERQEFVDALFELLSRDGEIKTLDELQKGGVAGMASLVKHYVGAGEAQKKVIREVLRCLAVDFKDELLKTAEQGISQVMKDLRKR